MPKYGEAPEFSLTDHRNQTFDAKQLDGKVWVADFFFFHMPRSLPKNGGQYETATRGFLASAKMFTWSTLLFIPSTMTQKFWPTTPRKIVRANAGTFLQVMKKTLLDLSVNGFHDWRS